MLDIQLFPNFQKLCDRASQGLHFLLKQLFEIQPLGIINWNGAHTSVRGSATEQMNKLLGAYFFKHYAGK